MPQPADLDAYDRKLRPVYDAIHAGNYKVRPSFRAALTQSRPCDAMHVCMLQPVFGMRAPIRHGSADQGALKLANAALSKYRGEKLLRSLKAHALDRGGRTDDALTVSGASQSDSAETHSRKPWPNSVLNNPYACMHAMLGS